MAEGPQRPSATDGENGDSGTSGNPFKGFAETTSRVVRQAASILEEEVLAAGIAASKGVERQFIDVDRIRSADPDAAVQRLRRDAHEVVDIFVDLVHTASDTLTGLAGQIVDIRGRPPSAESEPAAGTAAPAAPGWQTLSPEAAVAPGGLAMVSTWLDNKGDEELADFEIMVTDLLNSSGNRISASQVIFNPSPVRLAPKSTQRVEIVVRVPDDAPPGSYSGLLQATRLEQVRAILVVPVEAAAEPETAPGEAVNAEPAAAPEPEPVPEGSPT